MDFKGETQRFNDETKETERLLRENAFEIPTTDDEDKPSSLGLYKKIKYICLVKGYRLPSNVSNTTEVDDLQKILTSLE